MVFIETPVFTRQIQKLITDKSYSRLQTLLIKFPANGCRKIRWAGRGIGKRGGIRVIYYWVKHEDQCFMLMAYAKSRIDDLTKKQIAKARLYTPK